MGRKVHPTGFRLKIIRDWDARWYAERGRYVELLMEDLKLRKYIKERPELKRAGISRIEIEREPNMVTITVHTVRPGLIIGREGKTVKMLRADLKAMTDKTIRIEVSEIEKPDLDAQLVAENIASQLERRIGHGRAMKRAITQAMRQGGEGIRIEVAGRLGGSDMARREKMSEGRVPRNTLRANIDYGFTEALTTFGRIGVKVWIYQGDILTRDYVPSMGAGSGKSKSQQQSRPQQSGRRRQDSRAKRS